MNNFKVITKEDKLYPKKLLKIKNSPSKLYVLGDVSLLNKKSIAIIGSRDCTMYGYEQAKRFAKEIARENICVVSGMAIGIDSAAHIGAKNEVGKTVAVLGSGFNNIFPEENKELFYEILNQGGCIITEYEPDVEPEGDNFPRRNRIVSGLSDGVLVVEARYRSGTSITVKIARKQGKKIFCIPSNLGATTGVGTGRFIQEGAKLVLSPEDILIEIGIPKEQEDYLEEPEIVLKAEYKEIYSVLSKMPINVNDICRKTNKNIVEVNTTLTMLELEGLINQVGVNEFIKAR